MSPRIRGRSIQFRVRNGTRDGTHDQPDAGNQQKQFYAGSDDVTLTFIEGSGSALALEKTAPAYRRVMSDWLSAHGSDQPAVKPRMSWAVSSGTSSCGQWPAPSSSTQSACGSAWR